MTLATEMRVRERCIEGLELQTKKYGAEADELGSMNARGKAKNVVLQLAINYSK